MFIKKNYFFPARTVGGRLFDMGIPDNHPGFIKCCLLLYGFN